VVVAKDLKTAILILSTAFLCLNSAMANWFAQDMVVPPQTVEKKKQPKNIAGRDSMYTYYESEMGISVLKDFYRKELTRSGWRERELQQQLNKYLPEAASDSRYANLLDNNLMFEKENKELVISFVPQSMSNNTKTMFVTAETTVEKKSIVELIPKLTSSPKNNIAPVYPGAALIKLDETDNSSNAVYLTQDDTDRVLPFFKAEMPKYNWTLAEETPLRKIDAGEAEAYGLKELYLAELSFTNKEGDTCRIDVSKSEFKINEVRQDLKFTNIRVAYEKKK
jgi:hypothetical protein